jgi:hypothetical protein
VTDIIIKAEELAQFLKLDKAWRSELSQEKLARIGEYQMVWLPKEPWPETHTGTEKAPTSLPVPVHAEFADFLHERGFPYEVV